MTKRELADTIKENEVVLEYIEEASAYAHRKCPNVPNNVDAYDDNKFWGKVAAYLVAVARKGNIA